jgi:hypothetical protein
MNAGPSLERVHEHHEGESGDAVEGVGHSPSGPDFGGTDRLQGLERSGGQTTQRTQEPAVSSSSGLQGGRATEARKGEKVIEAGYQRISDGGLCGQ